MKNIEKQVSTDFIKIKKVEIWRDKKVSLNMRKSNSKGYFIH